MTKAFISYSHKDKEYAYKLADELARWGIEPWIDGRIDYGTQWPRVIEQNLNDCDSFILIMTPNSKGSDWVHNELTYAQSEKKQIFPLLLEGKTWLPVASIQHVDVRGGVLPPESFFKMLGGLVPMPPTGYGETSAPLPENMTSQQDTAVQIVPQETPEYYHQSTTRTLHTILESSYPVYFQSWEFGMLLVRCRKDEKEARFVISINHDKFSNAYPVEYFKFLDQKPLGQPNLPFASGQEENSPFPAGLYKRPLTLASLNSPLFNPEPPLNQDALLCYRPQGQEEEHIYNPEPDDFLLSRLASRIVQLVLLTGVPVSASDFEAHCAAPTV